MKDHRGALTAIESNEHVPFEIRRVFYVHGVGAGIDRGGHAHRDTDQMAIAVNGTVTLSVHDGSRWYLVILDDPTWGVILPRMTWVRMLEFSQGAVCLVLANTHYDMAKSIRTWSQYAEELGLLGETERVATEPLAGKEA